MSYRLKHLVVQPRAGLCNRMRAIASAKRLAELFGIKCTIYWDWGRFYELFQPDPLADCIFAIPPEMAGWPRRLHRHSSKGGCPDNWRLSLSESEQVILTSCYTFNAFEEPTLVTDEQIGKWYPRPTEGVMEKVWEFKQARFQNTVGVHIRGSDHEPARQWSPNSLFLPEMEALVAAGHTIFLATDNKSTEREMQERFGEKIILYPKNQKENRWPRKHYLHEETLTDLIDLHLLANCEFMIGSAHSSYSRAAMYFNGSPRCKKLSNHPRYLTAFPQVSALNCAPPAG